MPSPKEQFLTAYDREHATTKRLLKSFPPDKAELRPHPKAKNARELAWTFVVERGLGTRVWNDELAKGMPAGGPPPAPQSWNEVMGALDKAHGDFRKLVASAPDSAFNEKVHFFTAPKTMSPIPRIDFLWFLLMDEVHHRGQFSVYTRMADGKVPSIYGPSADDPGM